MRRAWKPAAYFCDGVDVDPSDQERAVIALADMGIVERRERRFPNPAPSRFHIALRETIYVLPDRTDLVRSLHRISELWAGRRPDIGFRLEYRCGADLGYSPAGVSQFIWRTFGRIGR